MATQLASKYQPSDVEAQVAKLWNAARAFHAEPDAPGDPYCIVIPPPNVTAALHLGHALNNTLQDILIRRKRMQGFNALWMPGTDHAGIATQTVVEKRVLAEEGRKRTDFQRDEFVAKIQAWKDEYEQRITNQLVMMGCSCDWDRQRFTMDDTCAKAVREAFFRLFKEGLIYRGKRLVNWDPATQTALADDEVEMQDIDGHFWYMKYPLEDGSGHVTVATTRPETMLGDTAVAVNPKDAARAHLIGKKVRLPIVNRVIPIVGDDYVVLPDPESSDEKAKFASGFLKVTPAHDPNDWEIGLRHNLAVINVMAPDGTISDQHGWDDVGDAEFLLRLKRSAAREAIVDWFRGNDLLEDVKPYRHSVGHSYRSHVPVEPYLSDQWYVKVTDDRLAGAALRAMAPDQRTNSASNEPLRPSSEPPRPRGGSATGASRLAWEGKLRFFPDRYAKTFETWHENIRDWCISRQLWWGHRIPVWSITIDFREMAHRVEEGNTGYEEFKKKFQEFADAANCPHDFALRPVGNWADVFICTRSNKAEQALYELKEFIETRGPKKVVPGKPRELPFKFSPEFTNCESPSLGLNLLIHSIEQDPDVLDTWFSSALWPFSTMGWPDDNPVLDKWNPGDVLCTAREIITLWVSRMVMTNLYFLDRLPFEHVFIHAMIQDGDGRKMSKSLGNGVDPLDIIHSHGADAMRYTLASMTTNTQDVRMPVVHDEQTGRNTSPKFDLGRNFANKMWNAVRFALTNLESPESPKEGAINRHLLTLPDRWILSRLARTIREVDAAMDHYEFSNYAQTLYDFFWRDLCDWYIEAIKPTVKSNPAQQQVLATCIDVSLRLLHPAMPFITEQLWQGLNDVVGRESALLVRAAWPTVDESHIDEQAETTFEAVREVVGVIRQVRTQHKTPPRQAVDCSFQGAAECAATIDAHKDLIGTLAAINLVAAGPDVEQPEGSAVALLGPNKLFLHGLIDTDAEGQRLSKRLEELNKSVTTLEGRLSNKSYTDKAPAHLVQQTRDQLADAQRERDSVEQQLNALNE